jgi:hypothetical protein
MHIGLTREIVLYNVPLQMHREIQGKLFVQPYYQINLYLQFHPCNPLLYKLNYDTKVKNFQFKQYNLIQCVHLIT